ncbi:hypothetical protein H257_11911 [Aphanomyces astaci]|uniref:Uncharacterized protein n=1 Tax=Aphanomyces astaci TaxID=112090 RepID=W4G1E9_APHAT|nr:hypothetical protein H257_11911 [Aphanomyces astaci]ETV73086.1 hypothetical protein H257_11911 [Aphanomyces astaci]|eukprot:XP_009837291.1 hypothetical protein H257_11911 [Aphanomyces astaci]
MSPSANQRPTAGMLPRMTTWGVPSVVSAGPASSSPPPPAPLRLLHVKSNGDAGTITPSTNETPDAPLNDKNIEYDANQCSLCRDKGLCSKAYVDNTPGVFCWNAGNATTHSSTSLLSPCCCREPSLCLPFPYSSCACLQATDPIDPPKLPKEKSNQLTIAASAGAAAVVVVVVWLLWRSRRSNREIPPPDASFEYPIMKEM